MKASLARGSRGGEFDNRETASRDREAARRARRARSATRITRLTSSTSRPRAAWTSSTSCSPSSGRPPWRTRGARPRLMQKTVDERGRRLRPSRPGTGRTTRRRCARPATRSTSRSSGPTTSSNRVLIDGVFFAAGKLYGLTLQGAQGPAGLRAERARVRRLRQGRLPARALRRRLLRAPQQERRRVGQRLRAAVRAARHEAGDREPPERPAAARRASRRC